MRLIAQRLRRWMLVLKNVFLRITSYNFRLLQAPTCRLRPQRLSEIFQFLLFLLFLAFIRIWDWRGPRPMLKLEKRTESSRWNGTLIRFDFHIFSTRLECTIHIFFTRFECSLFRTLIILKKQRWSLKKSTKPIRFWVMPTVVIFTIVTE